MSSKVKLVYWVDVFNTETSDFDTISIEEEHELVFLLKASKNTQEMLIDAGFEQVEIPETCLEAIKGFNIDSYSLSKESDDYEFLKEAVYSFDETIEDKYSPKMIAIVKGLASHIYDLENEDENDE